MIRIGIAEDQALFRKGIVSLLNSFHNMEVVEEAADGQEIVNRYKELHAAQEALPDITILDLNMPVLDGIKATVQLKELFPQLKIIIISSFDDQDIVVHLYEKGANAYLDKNAEPEEVEEAINAVFTNDFFFNKAAKDALEDASTDTPNTIVLHAQDALSKRELEVLKYICYANTTEEIANIMSVSKRTVDGHRSKLMQKTSSKNTTSLVLFALKAKLVNISELKVNLF